MRNTLAGGSDDLPWMKLKCAYMGRNHPPQQMSRDAAVVPAESAGRPFAGGSESGSGHCIATQVALSDNPIRRTSRNRRRASVRRAASIDYGR